MLSSCASSVPDPLPDYMSTDRTNIVVGNVDGSSSLAGMKLHIDDTLMGQFEVGEYIRFGLPPGDYEMKITGAMALFGANDKVKLRVRGTEEHAYNIGRTSYASVGVLDIFMDPERAEYLVAVNPDEYEAELKACCKDVSKHETPEK